MKLKPTSAPSFDPATVAAALAAAKNTPVVDGENPPTTLTDWQDAIVSHSLPEIREKLATRRRGPGRAPIKVPTTIRLDSDIVAAFKAGGHGWQTRVNEVLKEWVKTHPNG
jgi:uncharacterized protein (DUF4415 family)